LPNIDRKVVLLPLYFILLCLQEGESIVEYRQEVVSLPHHFILLCLQVGEPILDRKVFFLKFYKF
jgi:hypothetical protein